MDWEKIKNPSTLVSIVLFLSVLWSGGQVAKIPDRMTEMESNQRLLAYRMEQLEKAVDRSDTNLAKN